MNRSQLLREITDRSEVERKVVDEVLRQFEQIVKEQNCKKQNVTLSGFVNFKVRAKPATSARMGVNPFTGEQIKIKAKPASTVPRVLALKAFKDIVASGKAPKPVAKKAPAKKTTARKPAKKKAVARKPAKKAPARKAAKKTTKKKATARRR